MPESDELRIERGDQVVVVHAPNYINKDGGEQIGAAAEELLKEGANRVVVDLSDCALVNSVGISYIIEVNESVKEAGGHLAFCCASPTITKTLQIMGLLQSATVHDTQDEAVQRAAEGA